MAVNQGDDFGGKEVLSLSFLWALGVRGDGGVDGGEGEECEEFEVLGD